MKIGEFATLSSATIRTLRYYDELGILKPDSIDQFTGYRFYSSLKLEQMRQIQAMKEIGFTLLEIKRFLAIDISDENGKVDFIAAKKQEVELKKQQAETQLVALDEFIVKLKEGEKNMANNYCLPFCEMAGDQEFIERRKNHGEAIGNAYSEMETAPKFVKIAADNSVFGAVDEDGKVYMWGNNWAGQCDIPENLPPIETLSIGSAHVVALDMHGKLHKWGKSEGGSIDFQDDLPKMVSVVAKANKTVAISEEGRVFSWGSFNLGDQKNVPRNMGVVKQISVGAYQTATLNSEGTVFSWGIHNVNAPVHKAPGTDIEISMVAATDYAIAYLGVDGRIYGDAKHRELNKRYAPKPEMSNIKKLVSGRHNFAAIDDNGKLYVWGEYAKLPHSNAVAVVPLNLPPVVDVAFSYCEIMCLGADGKLYAWGITDVIVPPVFDGFANGPVFEPDETVDITIPLDVYTFGELCEAVQNRVQNITVKADMAVVGEGFYLMNDNTLIIDEGVTFDIQCTIFFVQKKLINNGTIKGKANARLSVNNPIEGTGEIIRGDAYNQFWLNQFWLFNGLSVEIVGISANEIRKYLAEDSIYTIISNIYNLENDTLVIDRDLVIPKNKMLRLVGNDNQYNLVVNEGVTLTVEGKLEVWKEPIIHGKVVGEIDYLHSPDGCEVYTYEKLCEVTHQVMEVGKIYKNIPKVTIKADMVATGESFKVDSLFTSLVVDEGARLTVDCDNFTIMGEFTNDGLIDGNGHIYTDGPIKGKGSVDTKGGLRVDMYDADTGELSKYLAEDSIYTEMIYITAEQPPMLKSIFNIKPDGEKTFIIIDKDLFVPKGKSIWINLNGILKVKENVTLTIEGELKTFNEPVIEGTVIGDITITNAKKACDVHTFAQFYEAARDRIEQITIKNDLVLSSSKEFLCFDTLIIDKGVTLTVNHCSFDVKKKLINNGFINGTGMIQVSGRIAGESGVDTSGGLKFRVKGIQPNEIGEYLAEDSIYSSVVMSPREDTIIKIESDLVIPKEKSLDMNYYGTLEVAEGVTLKIDGKLNTYNEPIIKGTVIGNIAVEEKYPFWVKT